MATDDFIDLIHNYPLPAEQSVALAASLSAKIAADSSSALRFLPVEGLKPHLVTAANWVSLKNHPIDPSRIAFGVSGHQALSSILLAFTRAGQAIACDPVTYNGWINISRHTERRHVPVRGDAEGMLPEALDEAARKEAIWGVFLMPSLHNPCATIMSLQRREAIVEVCRKHGLWILDDDAYRFLNPAAPASFAHLYPERSFWIQSLTKPLFPSVKTAIIVGPIDSITKLTDALRATAHGPSALTLPWVMDFLATKQLDAIVAAKLEEAKRRQKLARNILRGFEYQSYETSFHIWLL